MRRSETGRIDSKALLTLAYFAAVIFAGLKIMPVYISNFRLQSYIVEQNPVWLTQHSTAEAIRNNIVAKAQDLGLPVAVGDVRVDSTAVRLTVTVDYHVPVDLEVYTVQLHFSPSAENQTI
jgi:hypothetical protein